MAKTRLLLGALGCIVLLSQHATAAKIYWTSRTTGKIQRANLDGSQVQDVVTGLSGNYGLAIDEGLGRVYWTNNDGDAILRANLDGTGKQTLLTGLAYPLTIRLDVPNNRMYWKDALGVHRATLDGTNKVKLVTTTGSGQGLAIDFAHSRMYLSSHPEGSLQRANLDGTGLINLIDLPGTEGVELDPINSKLYLANFSQGTIGRSSLNGTGFQLLVPGLAGPEQIALDLTAGKMYWGEVDGGRIRRANLDGTGVQTIVANAPGVDTIRLVLDAVPEPSTLCLIAAAALLLDIRHRRRPHRPVAIKVRRRLPLTIITTVILVSNAATPNQVLAATWSATNPGNLLTGSNWSGGAAPNGIGTTAQFTTQPANSGDFTLNGSMTIGSLIYNNPGDRNLTGSGTLTFEATSGNALFHARNGGGAGKLELNLSSVVLASTTELFADSALIDVSAVVSGSGGILKTGFAHVRLFNPANSYTGLNDVRGVNPLYGVSIANFGVNSAFGRGNFALDNGSIQIDGPSAATDRNVTLGSLGGTLVPLNASSTITWTGPISGTGTLRKFGLGTLQLSGTNTYGGGTDVAVGTLRLGASERIPDGSAVSVGGAVNGTLDLNNFNETIGSLASFSATGNVLLGSGTLTTGGNNLSTTFSGVISGDGGLTKTGTGKLTLSGIGNSYLGTTTISGGTLSGSKIADLGTNSAFGQGNIIISNGATLNYTGASASTNRTFALALPGGGIIDIENSGSALTMSGAVVGASHLTKSGAGTLILTGGSHNYGGVTIVSGGTLVVDSIIGVGLGGVAVNAGATLTGAGAISGLVAVSNGGTLTGTLTLNGGASIANGGNVAPGTSAGTLTINTSFVLNPASNLVFELHGANQTVGAGVNDLIAGVTNLTLDGTLNVSEIGVGSFLSAQAGNKWRLITYSGSFSNNNLSLGTMPALQSGLAYSIDTSTFGQVNLLVSAVPEARAWLMLSTLIVGAAGARAICHCCRQLVKSRSMQL